MVPLGRGVLAIFGPTQGAVLALLALRILNPSLGWYLPFFVGGLCIGPIISRIEWALYLHYQDQKKNV